MNPILVMLAPEATHVRVLVTGPEGEMIRAVLGAPARMHRKPSAGDVCEVR
jgi:hypothetical protein